MSADRLAASNGGPGSPIPGVWVQSAVIASPRCTARLHFDTCATAPETRPLPAVLRTHPPLTSTDCPAASDGGWAVIPRPVVRGPIGHYAFLVALPSPPVAPHPAVLQHFGHATARCVDRLMASRHQQGTASGTGRRLPPPCFTPPPAIQL